MRDMAQEILESLGYRLILTRDGEEAVQEFMRHSGVISLVLLDVVMPKMSGTEAFQKICKEKPDVAVIFTSGYSEQGAFLTSVVAKGATVLQKPYGSRVLARKVREILDAAKSVETRQEVAT